MADVGVLNLQIKSNAGSAATSLGNLADALSRVKSAVGRGTLANNIGNVASALERLKQATSGSMNGRALSTITRSIANATKQLDTGAVNRLKTAADAIERYVNSYKSMSGVSSAGKTHLGKIPLNLGQFGEKKTPGLTDVQSQVQSQVQEALNTGKSSESIKEVTQNTQELTGSLQQASNAAEDLSNNLKNVSDDSSRKSGFLGTLGKIKEGLGNLQLPFSNLLSSFARIAKYRILRAIIKSISEGISEGVENVYKYSQAVGTSFAPTMDSLASTMAQFKNSVGAAVAPVLQALIPILNSIVNAAISVINVLNQLFAILGGKGSWTRALPVATKAFEDTKKAAGGAGGAVKEMLAAFDELNVIASESGGGGGGASSALADYESMFEEMYAFDEKIRDLVDWLKDNMESIKGIAIAIGAAILSWKLATAFADVLPVLSQIFGLISTGAVIAITLQVTWMLTNRYLDTKEPGWLIADLLTTAVGATAAAAIAQKFIGGNAAAYTAAITLTLSAVTGVVALLKDVDTEALSTESLLVALENSLKVGAAAGFLMKSVGGATLGTSILGGLATAITSFAVVIGLKTALDPNVELFSTQSIITAITTTGAAALGLAFISGSWAVAAGGALLYLTAYVGLSVMTSSSKIKWGDEHLTERQVENYVQEKMFRIDVKASIERINTTVEKTAFNRTELEKELSTLLGDLKLIKLGLADNQDYAEMQKHVDSIINRVHEMAESSENLAKLTLQFTPSLVGDNEQEQGDWFTSYTKGWDKVDEWFQLKGTELGGYFETNLKGEIVAKEPELIAAVLQQMADVMAAASEYKVGYGAYSELLLGIGDLDQASATDVIEKYNKYLTDLKSALEASAQEQLANQASLVGMLFKINPDSQEYKDAEAKLKEMTDNLVDGVEKDLEEAIGPGRDLIMKWIFGNHAKGSISSDWSSVEFYDSLSNGVQSTIKSLLLKGGVDKLEIEAMDLIGFTGWDLLSADLQNQLVHYASLSPFTLQELKDNFNLDANAIIKMSGWEKFEKDEKMKFVNTMIQVYGPSSISKIKSKLNGIKVSEIIEISDWKEWTESEQREYISSMQEAFGSDVVISALIGMGENVPKWVADGINKRTELKTALDSIGQQLKKAGITSQEILSDWDLTAPIIDNHNVQDSAKIIKEIVTTCGTDSKIIMRNWNLVAPEVSGISLSASYEAMKSISSKTGIDIATIVENWNLIAPSIDEKNIDNSAANISKLINDNKSNWIKVLEESLPSPTIDSSNTANSKIGVLSSIQGFMTLAKTYLQSDLVAPKLALPWGWGDNLSQKAQELATQVQKAIENIKPLIEVETDVTASISAVVTVTTETDGPNTRVIDKTTKPANTKVKVGNRNDMLKAEGAYGIPRGDVFIANEDGAEYVGSIGGKTSVANQAQIVEGIAAGVAASNEEQNILLREQNSLLRQILAKNNSVKFGASSAFGRTVKQSLEMYNAVGG